MKTSLGIWARGALVMRLVRTTSPTSSSSAARVRAVTGSSKQRCDP